MADVISEKLGRCEDDCEELRKRVDMEHDRLDSQSDTLERLAHWALEGNGESAESRLRNMERSLEVLPEMQTTLAAVRLVSDAKLSDIKTEVSGAVKTQMDARDRTVIAYVKAFAPYAATLAAVLVAVFK
jgi:hypothetical protein